MDYYNFLISKENEYLRYLVDSINKMEISFNDFCNTREFKLDQLLSTEINLERSSILKKISDMKLQINQILFNMYSYPEDKIWSKLNSNTQLIKDLNQIALNADNTRGMIHKFESKLSTTDLDDIDVSAFALPSKIQYQ